MLWNKTVDSKAKLRQNLTYNNTPPPTNFKFKNRIKVYLVGCQFVDVIVSWYLFKVVVGWDWEALDWKLEAAPGRTLRVCII